MASRLKALLRRPGGTEVPRDELATFQRALVRRSKVVKRIVAFAPLVRTLLVVAGLLYMLALPYKSIGRRHYISENALQPGQVNTYWNCADVHVADLYAESVAKWSAEDVTVEARSRAIQDAFHELGLSASQQRYTFELARNSTLSGINTYAILAAPKTDGAEALVLSASWLSRAKDEQGRPRINTRGVAIVLALANYFKKYAFWSKDIIFVISDGYSEGAQAWLDAYHDYGQSKGANGHMPNLDFINSVSRILRNTGIPTVLHSSDSSDTSFLPSFLQYAEIEAYAQAARNLFRQVALTADGRVLGPEGTFGKYRIDAITLFGLPAEGPHGFHSLGRATESIFRSLNNLLERFHQSFFLYIMTSIDSFIAVGNYLAAPILVGAGMTIQGLVTWGQAGVGKEGNARERPVARATLVLAGATLAGAAEMQAISQVDPLKELHQVTFACLSPTGIWTLWRTVNKAGAEEWLRQLLKDWQIGGGWSLPVALVLVGPLVVAQAVVVVL
ncbi:GPI-anchor transamidase [Rhodotorula toruloides ATCC 204091]|uniref:BY PROTMAP: gi/342319520/gb/EGU11468.1/ GPI-anchor transamidase [Rhodotorula glutinis ATCC 204091] n=1 Tax=Rhodotorula toruloides TaxID=5286 RepID=A0A0K3CPX5_RHOTO|nr:GPI-anchor transamidase [Rhodotorula toruloides ATCC 204091]